MKKAKIQADRSVFDREEPLNTPDNGTWHRIAEKAHELYEQRGRSHGLDVEDWLKAEAIITGETK